MATLVPVVRLNPPLAPHVGPPRAVCDLSQVIVELISDEVILVEDVQSNRPDTFIERHVYDLPVQRLLTL